MTHYFLPSSYTTISDIESSDWECYLFGGASENGIKWRPTKLNTPNAFWRFMQWVS